MEKSQEQGRNYAFLGQDTQASIPEDRVEFLTVRIRYIRTLEILESLKRK